MKHESLVEDVQSARQRPDPGGVTRTTWERDTAAELHIERARARFDELGTPSALHE